VVCCTARQLLFTSLDVKARLAGACCRGIVWTLVVFRTDADGFVADDVAARSGHVGGLFD
jgi:hypothetical protein